MDVDLDLRIIMVKSMSEGQVKTMREGFATSFIFLWRNFWAQCALDERGDWEKAMGNIFLFEIGMGRAASCSSTG